MKHGERCVRLGHRSEVGGGKLDLEAGAGDGPIPLADAATALAHRARLEELLHLGPGEAERSGQPDIEALSGGVRGDLHRPPLSVHSASASATSSAVW